MPNPYKILSLACIAAFSLGTVALFQPRPVPPDATQAPRLGTLYAAPVERVETHVIGLGENLGSALARARFNTQDMADLVLALRQHFDPRRIARNTEVTVRRWTRSDEPRAVDIRLDADRTVRLVKDGGGWNGEVVMTPTVFDTVFAAGVIEAGKTLSEAVVMDEQSRLLPQERYKLVAELASVFEFKIDFTREIQPGDRYRVVYEREVRPDGTARTSQVLAAEIVTRGVSYPAIWFKDAGNGGYYDPQARPLATGFSRYPVAYPRITSNYNPNRYHPILGVYRAHQGTDFGAATGTPVQATADGTVTFAGVRGGYGNTIEIQHMNGYLTRYAHLSRFASGVRTGTRVRQKQEIGYVGATGLATAPHLHYELRDRGGRAINAMTARLPDAPALTGDARSRFLALALERTDLLDRIPAGRYYAEARAQAAAEKAADEL